MNREAEFRMKQVRKECGQPVESWKSREMICLPLPLEQHILLTDFQTLNPQDSGDICNVPKFMAIFKKLIDNEHIPPDIIYLFTTSVFAFAQ